MQLSGRLPDRATAADGIEIDQGLGVDFVHQEGRNCRRTADPSILPDFLPEPRRVGGLGGELLAEIAEAFFGQLKASPPVWAHRASQSPRPSRWGPVLGHRPPDRCGSAALDRLTSLPGLSSVWLVLQPFHNTLTVR